MKIKTFFFFIVFTVILTGLNAQNFNMFMGGGLNFVGQYGSAGDYVSGENDFPVTPSHKNSLITGSLSYSFYKNFGILLKSSYHFKTNIMLEDPSDGDSVDIDTSPHLSLSLNIVYSLNKGRFQPFFYLGGGFDKIFPEDKVYTSKYGYEIVFLSPERTVDPMFNLGGGFDFKIISSIYFRVNINYMMIVSQSANIGNFESSAGVCLKF